MIHHAGLVALLHQERWRGILITGPAGVGKSDLAIRMIADGFALVADDRTILWTSGGQLWGRAPEPLAGLIEQRGMGIADAFPRDYARIEMVVEIDAAGAIERMPDAATVMLLNTAIPLVRQRPFEDSAPAKLRRWLMALG